MLSVKFLPKKTPILCYLIPATLLFCLILFYLKKPRYVMYMRQIFTKKVPMIIIIIIKYQIYIALISNKCSEALNSATQNIIYKHSILMTSVIAMKP